MRVLWKGTISFGLVSIPIALYPATEREVASIWRGGGIDRVFLGQFLELAWVGLQLFFE